MACSNFNNGQKIDQRILGIIPMLILLLDKAPYRHKNKPWRSKKALHDFATIFHKRPIGFEDEEKLKHNI